MLKATGEIVCRFLDCGEWPEVIGAAAVACEWKGGRVSVISGEALREARAGALAHSYMATPDVLVIGELRLRVLGIDCSSNAYGAYMDRYLVMQDGRLARVTQKYRRGMTWALRKFIRVEAYFRSYGIPELSHGKFMPVTTWLSNKLL